MTLQSYELTDEEIHFNSHAHVERDLNPYQKGCIISISTHTLTWSVTYLVIKNFVEVNFNSHAHVERDEFNQPYF